MTIAHCPLCGSRMLVRHGVALPRHKAELFDMIERASDRGGITSEVLAGVFYPGQTLFDARRCIYQHINQINGLLASTDKMIVNTPSVRPTLYRVATAKSGSTRLFGMENERRGKPSGGRRG